MKKIVLLVAASVVIILGYLGVSWLSFLSSSPEDEGRAVLFEVIPGASLFSVTRNLRKENLVTDFQKFVYLARLKGLASSVRVGEYELKTDMTPGRVLEIITSGVSVSLAITFQEGLNVYEIAEMLAARDLVDKQEFLDLCFDRELVHEVLGQPLPSFEGYLFPDTYHFTKYSSPRKIIEVMTTRFFKAYEELGNPLFAQGLNRHQIVNLASIVEKETGAPEERPMVASVFHNRLRKRMRLGSDPTIIYGIAAKTGKMIKNIRRKHIDTPTDYNTYTRSGLPYGPIANPGKAALEAALNPQETDYLYFVSRNDGTHYFSKTYREHLKAVREYQLKRSSRKGKSWRDLKKRKK